MSFYLKQNDTQPNLDATLLTEDGLPVDLSVASAVRFHMRNAEGTVVVDEAMIVVDATGGLARYVWDAADTTTVGTFQAEVEVTFANGKIETFPNSSYLEVVITDDIA